MGKAAWQVRAYSTALTALLSPNHDLPLTLLSSHPHACNLLTPTGELLALVTPTNGNGPFHALIATETLPDFPQGTPARYYQGQLSLGDQQITFSGAVAWNPQLPGLRQNLPRASSLLHEYNFKQASGLSRGPAPLVQRVQNALETLEAGITPLDAAALAAGVHGLAGLGPGLTPAGDDFLVGVLAALDTTGAEQGQIAERREVSKTIVAEAAPRTTRLSAAWLAHAGVGHFGEVWHGLIEALNHGHPTLLATAVRRMQAIGATSGSDGLFGFTWALQRCQRIR